MKLESLLTEAAGDSTREREIFALLNLGTIEGLDHGSIGAIRFFFNADNCLYVRKRLKGKIPDRIKSKGVQLPDLFDVLPRDEAHREFKHELEHAIVMPPTLRGSRQNNKMIPDIFLATNADRFDINQYLTNIE